MVTFLEGEFSYILHLSFDPEISFLEIDLQMHWQIHEKVWQQFWKRKKNSMLLNSCLFIFSFKIRTGVTDGFAAWASVEHGSVCSLASVSLCLQGEECSLFRNVWRCFASSLSEGHTAAFLLQQEPAPHWFRCCLSHLVNALAEASLVGSPVHLEEQRMSRKTWTF